MPVPPPPGEDLPHSALYFGDARDYWWNERQIVLVAEEIGLCQRRAALDVGCGYGHWARTWMRHLPAGARVASVDPEPRSLEEAEARNVAFARDHGLDVAFSFHRASVEALPFEDGAFDFVTAQTLLIHVPDVARAIAELTRVLAPGGTLLLVEPNNLASVVSELVDGIELDVDRVLMLTELEARIERGKHALGQGFNSLGEILPGHLPRERFTDLKHWLCDRAIPIVPPYDSPETQAEVAELRDFFARGIAGRPREQALAFFVAGGGTADRFDVLWRAILERDAKRLRAIDAGTHASAGGHVFHVLAATKR